MKIYSLYDKIRESWTPIFLSENPGSAARLTYQSIKLHFSDYELYELGNFDHLKYCSDNIIVNPILTSNPILCTHYYQQYMNMEDQK